MTFHARRAVAPEDLELARALRHEVFVREQGVPEALEHDVHDAGADHVVALDPAGRVVATGRLVVLDARQGKVGRMAVAREARGQGAGAAVLAELERIAGGRGLREIVLHAQVSARGFYDRTGYVTVGGEFEEAGIRHVEMRKALR